MIMQNPPTNSQKTQWQMFLQKHKEGIFDAEALECALKEQDKTDEDNGS